MAKPDFRAAAAARLTAERSQGLSQNVLSLLSADDSKVVRPAAVRNISVDKVDPNPNQPRMAMDKTGLEELAASVREHGVLQPVLVRPEPGGRYELIAGERRWRAAQAAGLEAIPALIEEIDDETALEIAVIENLQREDLSPLDEAQIYAKMIHQHGYSIRKLAQKLGKDKGYLENRLRLADAPPEIRELVSVRKDTLSHAYELLKVQDQRKRRHLADLVARGELSLVKLRERIDAQPRRKRATQAEGGAGLSGVAAAGLAEGDLDGASPGAASRKQLSDDSLTVVKTHLNEAIADLVTVLQSDVMHDIDEADRQNLAKYLMIVKVRIENAIGVVKRGQP